MDVSEGFEETFKCVRGVLFAILNVIGNYYVFHSDQLIAVLYILGGFFLTKCFILHNKGLLTKKKCRGKYDYGSTHSVLVLWSD